MGPQWGRSGECGSGMVKESRAGGPEGKWEQAGNSDSVITCKNEVILVSKLPEQYQLFVYLRDSNPRVIRTLGH